MGSFTGHTSTPQDAMQALMRARGVAELTVYAARGRGEAVSVQEALGGAAAVDEHEAGALGHDSYGTTAENYEWLRAEVEAQRSRRQAGYKNLFVLKAAKLGFDTTIDVARDIGPDKLQRRDDRRAALKASGLERYVSDRVDAERIDADRAERYNEAYSLSQDKFFALEQYQLRAFYALPDDVSGDDLADMLRRDDYRALRDRVMRYENFIEPRAVAEARARGELDVGVLKGDAKAHLLRHEYHRQLGKVVGLDAETEAHAEQWQRETDDLEAELHELQTGAAEARTRRKGELDRQVKRLETDLEAHKLKTFGAYTFGDETVETFIGWCSKNYRALKHAGLVTATLDNLKAKPLETIGDSLRRAGLEQRTVSKSDDARVYALTFASVSGMCNYSRPRRKNWQSGQQTNIKTLDKHLLPGNAVLASQTGLITPPQNPEHYPPALHGPDDLKNWLDAGKLDAYGPQKLRVIREKLAQQDIEWLHRLANSCDTGRILGGVR